jgi:hypothetical protein
MAPQPSRARAAPPAARPRAILPPPTWRSVATLAVGGAFAIHAFELVTRVVSPLLGQVLPLFGAPLSAVPLAEAALASLWDGAGASLVDVGFALHLAVGLVLQPLGYVALARPLMALVAPRAPWWAGAFVYGVALWGAAMLALGGLSTDEPPYLDFLEIGWTALWGHVAAAMVIGGVWRARMGR